MRLFEIGELALFMIVGLALLVAVCRANKDDLPAIVRALMRADSTDDDHRLRPPRRG